MIATKLDFFFSEQSFHSKGNPDAVVIEVVGETVTPRSTLL